MIKLKQSCNIAPHINVTSVEKEKKREAFITTYTDNYDCTSNTSFYYVVKDDGFDISKLNAKKRYEVNKGRKNFYTRVINPMDFKNEIYDCYLESLEGYSKPYFEKREEFENHFKAWASERCVFFAVFDRNNNKLCGYSDVYKNGIYLPISSFKTRPSMERGG